MREKWLITGGCGFVGSNLAASLVRDGHEVVALDNLSRVGSAANMEWMKTQVMQSGRGKLTVVLGDTRNRTDVDSAFERHGNGVTAIVHAAGQVAMTVSLERPRLDFEVNALGAINVLEATRQWCPQAAVLFSSTNKVYGDLTHLRYAETDLRWTLPDLPHGVDESAPLGFHSPYGCSKGAADQYFLDYHRMFGLRTVVFRHSSMYGGRQFATFDQGWVGWFALQVKSGVEFTISGDGKQVRDLLHADDLVQAYRLAAAGIDRIAGRAFNIGGGPENSMSLLELLAALQQLTGNAPRYTRLPARASDQRVFIADTRAALAAFGWRPTVGRMEGLAKMLRWLDEVR